MLNIFPLSNRLVTRSLQIFESHRNPYPSNNDVWRYDERLLTKVVDTNIKIFDVSNKERCGQEPSRKIQPTDSVSHVSFPLSNSVFCSSPESEFEMNGGIWVSGRICRPSNKKVTSVYCNAKYCRAIDSQRSIHFAACSKSSCAFNFLALARLFDMHYPLITSCCQKEAD